jgi:hypothetical protein
MIGRAILRSRSTQTMGESATCLSGLVRTTFPRPLNVFPSLKTALLPLLRTKRLARGLDKGQLDVDLAINRRRSCGMRRRRRHQSYSSIQTRRGRACSADLILFLARADQCSFMNHNPILFAHEQVPKRTFKQKRKALRS